MAKKLRRNKISQGRRGPFSAKEKKQIAEFIGLRTPEEIAILINRGTKQVADYCKTLEGEIPVIRDKRTEDEDLKIELQSQVDWKLFQTEFTNDELMFMEGEYIGYRKQFGNITKTETKQLHQLIILDIKMHRHNKDLMKDDRDIERMEKLLAGLHNENTDVLSLNNPNTVLITELTTQLQSCRTTKNARGKEYKDLLDKHSSILKDLKSTRDQRIKNIEDRGKFIELLKQLEVQERRNAIDEIVGLMDLATENEMKRLGALHKYQDGSVDRPILTPETIEMEQKNDEGTL